MPAKRTSISLCPPTQGTVEATQPEPTEPPVEPEPSILEEPEPAEPPAETEPPAPEEPEPSEPPTETEPPTPEELEPSEPPTETEPPTSEGPEAIEPPTETEPPTPEEPVSPEPPEDTESSELEESELPELPEEVESDEPEDLDTEIDDTPVIQVTVPRSGRVIVNPYSLPVEIGDEISTDQIASEIMTICNTSNVPVVVSASVAGHISEFSNMTFASAPIEPDSKDKNVFLYAEFQNENGLWSGEFDSGDNQILICEGISAVTDVLTLDTGSSEGAFRIFGETSVHPTEPWSEGDCFSVTFTFTFSPVVSADEVQPSSDLEFTELPELCDTSTELFPYET